MSDRQTYTVITDQPLAILGRMHKPGSTVDLHPKQAAAHLRAGSMVAGTPPAPKATGRRPTKQTGES